MMAPLIAVSPAIAPALLVLDLFPHTAHLAHLLSLFKTIFVLVKTSNITSPLQENVKNVIIPVLPVAQILALLIVALVPTRNLSI